MTLARFRSSLDTFGHERASLFLPVVKVNKNRRGIGKKRRETDFVVIEDEIEEEQNGLVCCSGLFFLSTLARLSTGG